MRILHISKYYYPYVGGVENVCKYLADNSAGHEVAVVCFNEGHLNSVGDVDGIKVYRIGALVTVARQAISLTYITVLRKVIKQFKPISSNSIGPIPFLRQSCYSSFRGTSNSSSIGTWISLNSVNYTRLLSR